MRLQPFRTLPRRGLNRLRRMRRAGFPVRRARGWLPYALVLIAAAAGVAALAVRPDPGPAKQPLDYVVVAGAAGLRWDDLDPELTPALWAEAGKGSVGWLSVRSGHRVTCPADGWLTLGAGNYAAWSTETVRGQCPPLAPGLTQPDSLGADIEQQDGIVRNNQALAYGAVPGALAESVRCTVAVGPGAAIAAARPFGRVDRYEAELPADAKGLLDDCVLSIVDLGTVSGSGSARRAAVARADALLARVVAARPDRSLIVVAGVGGTSNSSRLHVAMAEGEGWDGGWLTSAGTGRDGYLQLVDLAPTVLAALGRQDPQGLFTGRSATTVPGRPADLADAVRGDHDADRRATAQRGVADEFFTALAAADLLLFLAAVPLMVRARRHAGPRGPASPPRILVAAMEVALIAVALVLPAALLADAVPWWRGDHPALFFAAVTLVLTVIGTVAVRVAPRYRRTLWPIGAVAGIGAVVVGADLLTGAQLQLNGVAGYSAATGGRYAGVGSVGLGVFVTGMLVVAGCLAQWIRKPWRPLVTVLIGGVAVVMVGSPYLGADPAGAIAVTAGVCVAAAISSGGWLTFPRFAWAAVAGLAVTIGFAVLDLRRPPAEQGSLGRILTSLADGTAGPAMQRAAAANGLSLVDSPLTVLAVVGVLMLAFCQFSPWGGLNRLFGLHPALRAAGAGVTVAALIAGPLGGTALTVAGAAAAVAVPVAVLTALRVLDHAADRTRPDDETDGPGGPGFVRNVADTRADQPEHAPH
ncbi:hypothetical protein Acsp02_94030 [Actinoplanes sp. NBRC 103695]|nr:hypothetical protein Acsp02_94030 [Actinoplanes sp. NBRC 103695]